VEHDSGPESGGSVGVCYVTALSIESADVSTLRVRIELTHDVDSEEVTTRYAVGPDAAGEILRQWMEEMCARR
jgi:hypothetical protein